ncbi:IS66 family transposase zinc-finger binding domain-containing protein [Pseudanabaena sp. FACHB-2040]|uniref:IS66 family transposase zinc-finger binding domain-containing protein n=1 Tax=Pseudanabaena sp. FACHB-2040 TaxID=2692859 RepID=UPI001686A89F|nr:IS66 family transposase zinc-finger binding domain-containing protein [Pseudanabaena sp. FACHB-2040]
MQTKSCPHCGAEVDAAEQQLKRIYERIELPPVKVQVTRVERYGGTCPCCQQTYEAPVPAELEPGSPLATLLPAW